MFVEGHMTNFQAMWLLCPLCYGNLPMPIVKLQSMRIPAMPFPLAGGEFFTVLGSHQHATLGHACIVPLMQDNTQSLTPKGVKV